MDDSHAEDGGREASPSCSAGPCTQPARTAPGVEDAGQVREECSGQLDEEQTVAGQELMEEACAAENEEEIDLEEDQTGLKKDLRSSFKAVKRLFKGSGDQGKGGDPESTSQPKTPPPQVPPEDFSADGDVYDFTHKKRGRAIIINNEKFLPYSAFDSRPGSYYDEHSLKEVFKHLGFDVNSYNDLTAEEIKYTLEKEASQYDHHNADCLAVAILSHGDSEVLNKAWSHHQYKAPQRDDKVRRDLIFGVDGSDISTASIIHTFQDDRCPGLQGKPRLFFLQACRGDSFDDGVKVHVIHKKAAPPEKDDKDSAGELEETDEGGLSYHRRRYVVSPAPIFKDFLVMYATTPGHFAWRRSSGAWFIQSLHSVFMKQLTQHMSLTQALTRVIHLVAHGYESQGDYTDKKQTPVLESMLTKDLYFKRK
ncbi:hypothetical protein ACOMHN_045033 [Nucella lapillus]